MLPIIDNHDQRRFEVYCYTATPGEARSEQIWREIAGLRAGAIAAQIESDCIDILVDFDGHFHSETALAVGGRPAPVQVSQAIYPVSVGLTATNYRLTDALCDPPGATEHLHTGQLHRLPTWGVFAMPAFGPNIEPLPYTRHGFVTFGVFGNPIKITRTRLESWAEILTRRPSARLCFHHALLGDGFDVAADIRTRLLTPFLEREIDPDRIALLGRLGAAWDHLDFHNEVDLLLDTWPYGGSTTTVEALWMGTPTISMWGDSLLSRMSAAFMTQAGLEQLTVGDEEAYVEKAVEMADNPAFLESANREGRDRLQSSPVLDAPGYVRSLEGAYLELFEADPTLGA